MSNGTHSLLASVVSVLAPEEISCVRSLHKVQPNCVEVSRVLRVRLLDGRANYHAVLTIAGQKNELRGERQTARSPSLHTTSAECLRGKRPPRVGVARLRSEGSAELLR